MNELFKAIHLTAEYNMGCEGRSLFSAFAEIKARQVGVAMFGGGADRDAMLLDAMEWGVVFDKGAYAEIWA